jgi:hypothetical protein
MIKRLLSLFRGSPPTGFKKPPSSSPQGDDASLATWFTKDEPENPFGVDGFDCYEFVSSMLSTTKDPDIARSFVSLRSTDGQEIRGTLPDDCVEVPCSLSYEYGGETVDGILFKSSVMEEKWDIYLYDNRVYFCRSWTGSLTFVAEITPAEKLLRVSRLWASRSEETAFAVQQVDYLIKSHLYKLQVPHPLPQELQNESKAAALYSFSQYGRICCFGTFENTLGPDILKNTSRTQSNT